MPENSPIANPGDAVSQQTQSDRAMLVDVTKEMENQFRSITKAIVRLAPPSIISDYEIEDVTRLEIAGELSMLMTLFRVSD